MRQLPCDRVRSSRNGRLPERADRRLIEVAQRIRRPWFDRFVRQPTRIVRRMEMPSIQTPVRGVLDDNLALQLDALWYVLKHAGIRSTTPRSRADSTPGWTIRRLTRRCTC